MEPNPTTTTTTNNKPRLRVLCLGASLTAGSSHRKVQMRVLTLGDSLTSGYPPAHPYAGKLLERLEAAFPGHEVEVDVDGVPGDTVTRRGTFAERMLALWDEAHYDWTIVLGGTNDLAWGASTETLLGALKEIYAIPLSRGGKVLALTIPEIKGKFPDIDERRSGVNEGIKNYKKKNYYSFDLRKAVPYHDMPPADRPKYWDMDGVHFTEEGYNLIGEKVAESLIKIVHLEEAQSTEISSIVTNERQRKLIEEMIFEEERGNPKLLSQGYVIVRKSDLD